MITVRDVNRVLRAELWSSLAPMGFLDRTDRAAWRQTADWVDVIDVQSTGAGADAIGCTSMSFSAHAATAPGFLLGDEGRSVDKEGRYRPHYWESPLQFGLTKTLSQLWFQPFAKEPSPGTPRSVLMHREGLRRVLRNDRHDRPDIWYVREDGSNLNEVVADLRSAVLNTALPVLDRAHDPCKALAMIAAGQFVNADSPIGLELTAKARAACAAGGARTHVTFGDAD
jgi:hypothetical protein